MRSHNAGKAHSRSDPLSLGGVDIMRRLHADYNAVSAALYPHQAKTFQDAAEANGLPPQDWPSLPVCCNLAATLAVHNLVARLTADGMTARRALAVAAAQLDLDLDTIRRRHRSRCAATSPE
jgi:hypothetical protein